MRFLADENIPLYLVAALRRDGHDVVRVDARAPERNDEQVLARATADDRTLITMDTDFGELVFRVGVPADSGVILLRMVAPRSRRIATLRAAIATRDDWHGVFAVVTERRVRVVPLPRAE